MDKGSVTVGFPRPRMVSESILKAHESEKEGRGSKKKEKGRMRGEEIADRARQCW